MIRKTATALLACACLTSLEANNARVCQTHISVAEKNKGIQEGLLEAIAMIESKLNPYAVNVQGRSHHFCNAKDAACFVNTKISQGVQNISVGAMQLHVPSHRRHFKTIEEMMDPQKNIAYAAKYLKYLERQYGSSEKAVRYYHSPDSYANTRYKDRVFGAWAKIKRRGPVTLCPVTAQKITQTTKKADKPDSAVLLCQGHQNRLHELRVAHQLRLKPESLTFGRLLGAGCDQLRVGVGL